MNARTEDTRLEELQERRDELKREFDAIPENAGVDFHHWARNQHLLTSQEYDELLALETEAAQGTTPRVEKEEDDHGKSQAKAQYESISEMVAALNADYDRLQELREARDDHNSEVSWAGEDKMQSWRNVAPDDAEELAELEDAVTAVGTVCEDQDEARQLIEEDALEVQVRSGWVTPGEEMVPEEFTILLCTGGPAARIRGELDQYGQPSRAWIEYQDWGTPWMQYIGADQDVLLDYARVFYFGEG